MHCKNCGVSLNDKDKFCNNCGMPITSENVQVNKNTNKVTEYFKDNNQHIQSSFDEQFIKTYIGAKADKMYESVKNGGINIWSILFGIVYFAYRKMYLVSILTVIIANIINYLIPYIGNYIGMFVGLMFCPLYKWDITRKLRQIKKENPTATETQLLELAKNKGGTSIVGAIMFFAIYFIMIILFI